MGDIRARGKGGGEIGSTKKLLEADELPLQLSLGGPQRVREQGLGRASTGQAGMQHLYLETGSKGGEGTESGLILSLAGPHSLLDIT